MGGSSEPDVILETTSLTKSFGGFVAVNNVNLKVRRGQIHALIGPNGAGKSTLFNLLTRFLEPTTGSIRFNGTDITKEEPWRIARSGMVRSFQISAVFPRLSSARNVRIALQSAIGASYRFWRSKSTLDVLDARVAALLEKVGLAGCADLPAGSLPYGQRRALELATTLALEPQILLLDEPTQGMGLEDVRLVTDLIKQVGSERTVLMVEHNMGVVSSIADTISVLQRGSIIAEGSYTEVSSNPAVVEAYMGRQARKVA